jgi:hypothetical protein
MGRYESPEAAYFAFLETFNARDAEGWAGVNSWPHARISAAAPDSRLHWRPPTRVFANADEYLAAPLWDELEATGWAQSESSPPRIVQSSEVKAHIAGGWTRCAADGTAMASNRVVYVATRTADSWGLQAQLKTDSFVEGRDYSTDETAILADVESTLALLGAGRVDEYCAALAYPFTLIGPPGVVIQIDSASEMAAAMRSVGDDQLNASPGSVQIVNCGDSGANVTFQVQREHIVQEALALVGFRDGILKMLAISGL